MKKIGMLLALLALLMAALPGALAETVTYLDANGDLQAETNAQPFQPIKASGGWAIGEVGKINWYYLRESMPLDGLLGVNGYVHLILEDGATLTARDGIALLFGSNNTSEANATLTIYAQSQGKDMGRLIAIGKNDSAGIWVRTTATLTINGGYIEATGGDLGGAGIGGRAEYGSLDFHDSGTVIINGGVVIAQGGEMGGSGIGGGNLINRQSEDKSYGGRGANLTINGGLVTAIGGGEYGKAIGSGHGYIEQPYKGTLKLGDRIAVYDDTKDVQLTGSDDAILNQIIGTFGQKNQIQKVVFETHTGYQIVESDQYVQPTGTLSMTASGEFGDFQYLRLDNKKLDKSFYTTAAGSTVATVNMAALGLAPDTQHTLSFIYPDGSANGQFSVVLQLPAETIKDLPQTGDNSRLLLYVGLALACGVAVCALLIARKRR